MSIFQSGEGDGLKLTPVNNLYLVDSDAGWLPVVASSRGQARCFYLSETGMEPSDSEDFTSPLSIRILAHGVDGGAGIDMSYGDDIAAEICDHEYVLMDSDAKAYYEVKRL